MSSYDRFAQRKKLIPNRGLVVPRSQPGGESTGNQTNDPLAAAIDQILAIRARDRVTARLEESKMVLLLTVAVPFGLGHLVAAYDRTGGDVHTVHNVRNGGDDAYVTDVEKHRYENRGPYKVAKAASHKTETYKSSSAEATRHRESGLLEDPYGNQLLAPGPNGHDIDHTVSSYEVFHDRGRVLAGTDTAELSTIPENLNPTHPSINRSKKGDSVEQFLDRLERNATTRKERISELEAKARTTELTVGEQKELASRKALDSVDPGKMRKEDAEARAAINKKINKDWYTSARFAGEAIRSMATSAATTGIVSAFGELLIEFLSASYDEARDWYLHGTGNKPAFDDLKQRLERVATRVLSRKDAAWQAFKAGSLAGFIASLISVIINAFKTTQKRIQRLLREGAQSLVRVISLISNPSKGMSTRESLYAATHIVLSTGIVMGGVALEEVLEDLIKTKLPPLAPISEPTAVIISGIVAGLTVVLTSSLLDRWDPYGVIEEQDLRHSIETLRAEADAVWGAPVPPQMACE